LADFRAALDIQTPIHRPDLIPLLDALIDDFHPFAIEQIDSIKQRVYFFATHDRDDANQAIVDFYESSGVTVSPIDIPYDNWAERTQKGLCAIRISGIVVAPPWDIPDYQSDSTSIVIQPSMGFGTGHHASTRVCLRALQALSLTNKSVLDIGTGSGVLAIAAAKLGSPTVTGIDCDLDALNTALSNVTLNKVSHLVRLSHDDIRKTDKLDSVSVVVANISAALVCEYTEEILQTVKGNGRLIVGGFTVSEESRVSQTLELHGALASRHMEDEWLALTFAIKSTRKD
jgi:ribosomal protein L11 methyltransferase